MSMVAMCRDCKDEPLVCTFAFYKKEFICLGCGTLYEWLEPKGAPDTKELTAKAKAREEEWEENAGKHLLTVGAKHTDCEKCKTSTDYSHKDHATEEEIAADEKARIWIQQRTAGVHV